MFIKDTIAISPQNTYNNDIFSSTIKQLYGNKFLAIEPEYTGIIKPNQLRRMGRSLRMGIGCALPLLRNYCNVDGIIIGSSEGGLEDCIKFLNQIKDYEEGMLTPTNFVQSTPNALAGQLALLTSNNSYNTTHVHKGLAFENALIDAKILLLENKVKRLLVGGVEEISNYNFNIEKSAGQFKDKECSSSQLIYSNTKGTVCGEGSTMFILESLTGNNNIKINDIQTITFPTEEELHNTAINILKRNNLKIDHIDILIFGMNGDIRSDYFYYRMMEQLFVNQSVLMYKNLVGEYPTSSAFALYLAYNILLKQYVPKDIIFRQEAKLKYNNILIYNHYKGIQHSFILVTKENC
ncbi:MAG: hypothetical protein A2X12_01795 [Bacteroidetes bacterium GWE2_29_8]|nr:MAG: hypothetical protein A2X12_01795 [Bacteroidetes bacterium GWE2_29_8]OFY17902.1 MAG: hypothetical protein A2X02_00545 [Bacteroidetes bacterium GWF2_29_10]